MVNDKLKIKIYKMKDSRFKIRYYWGYWDRIEVEYLKTIDELKTFVKELITGSFS